MNFFVKNLNKKQKIAISNLSPAPLNILNPYFVTGFTDAEGSFMITIDKSNRTKIGYQVRGRYLICLHEKDLQLLCQIKDYFAVGSIVKNKKSVHYVVTNLKELVDVV